MARIWMNGNGGGADVLRSGAVTFATAALLAGLIGCEATPTPGARPTATNAFPISADGNRAGGGVPSFDPEVLAQLDAMKTQLGAPQRPTVVAWATPDDELGNAADGAGHGWPTPPEPVQREVIEATVTPLDQRVDASAPEDANGLLDTDQPAASSANGNAVASLYDEASSKPEPAVAPRSREALLAELHERLLQMEAPPLRRALALAGLSLADPTRTPDEALLSQLDPGQRALVEAYAAMLVDLAQRIDAGQVDALDAETVAESLADHAGGETVALRNATLCRRVSGFGVYEPFDSDTFLAGRENRVIVYAEIDGFAAAPRADGVPGYEVKLEQEVVLYNEADGLAVWRHPAQPVHDLSRRQRRDFWVVQMVAMPANLGVGRYRLKIRVTDQLGGTVDETTLPVRIVADDAARRALPATDDQGEDADNILKVFEALQQTKLPN